LDLQFNQSRSAVEFAAFKTLNPGLWVKGDVVNAFAMNILRPKFRNRGVHFFSSYFFSSLLETRPTGRLTPSYNYNYQAVKNWGNKT
jgi:Ulp1 family protease